MRSPRNLSIGFLILLIFASFYYSVSGFNRYKSEIVIQVADFMEALALPYRIAKLSSMSPDESLPVPVFGVRVSEIEDSWGAPRPGGREHIGVDIFASRGTPVYAAANGYVTRIGKSGLGGNYIYTVGAGGRRYYYAHLDKFVSHIKIGMPVTTDTIIGFVGNTGNASTTPPHLHFGMYIPRQGAQNPHELLAGR